MNDRYTIYGTNPGDTVQRIVEQVRAKSTKVEAANADVSEIHNAMLYVALQNVDDIVDELESDDEDWIIRRYKEGKRSDEEL